MSRQTAKIATAVARPQATFEGQELNPELFTTAAALMASLAQNPPFVDGNKQQPLPPQPFSCGKTAVVCGHRMMNWRNSRCMLLRVSHHQPSIEEMADWLRTRTINL